MMVVEIELPRLAGVRAAADRILDPLSGRLGSQTVVINARLLTTGTPSFADELVVRLKSEGADAVELLGAPDQFSDLMARAAKLHGLESFSVADPSETTTFESV